MDKAYRKILISPLIKTKFYANGWGDPFTYREVLKLRGMLKSRSECARLLLDTHKPEYHLQKVERSKRSIIYAGHFTSPLATLAPGVLPAPADTARFQLIIPTQWRQQRGHKPVYIHLAGTGDHYFWRRYTLTAEPLLRKMGVGALILENPFYGTRKPTNQTRSYLLHVSDLLVMGLGLMLECYVLSHWLRGEGYGPLGVTGISMGGHNAALSATILPSPHAIVPCFSWTTAATVFTHGLLTEAVDWATLHSQLTSMKQNGSELWEIISQNVPMLTMCPNVNERQSPNEKQQPFLKSVPHLSQNWLQLFCHYKESFDLMYSILEYATHLKWFLQPVSGTSAVFVQAVDDQYVPRLDDISSVWPDSEVRIVKGGHIAGAVFKQNIIRQALSDAMEKQLLLIPTT